MNSLPAVSSDYIEQFKAKIQLEKRCIQLLIQWGLTENAFDLYRIIEERLNSAAEPTGFSLLSANSALLESDKHILRETLREHYAKTRDFPRSQACRALLHNGLLTGFEKLISEIDQLVTQYAEPRQNVQTARRAA